MAIIGREGADGSLHKEQWGTIETRLPRSSTKYLRRTQAQILPIGTMVVTMQGKTDGIWRPEIEQSYCQETVGDLAKCESGIPRLYCQGDTAIERQQSTSSNPLLEISLVREGQG